MFFKIAASGKAVASKFAKVVEDILFASIIDVNSLPSPSLAEKIYPCPAIVPKANASGI